MKLNFMYLIIFFTFLISIYNLFYKSSIYRLFQLNKKPTNFLDLPTILYSDDKLFCSISGYKCENDLCDCKTICNGQYNKFKIYPDENVVMFNEKLSPGTYCLPKGLEHCNMQSSYPIYSANGWICLPKNPSIWSRNHFIACQHSYAQDNSLNVLLDLKENKVVTGEDIKDFYELHNGKLRYQCNCASNDKSGNKLINLDEFPFKCFSDYCLLKLRLNRKIPGWNNVTKECDCGNLLHENPNDFTSPCIDGINELNGVTLTSSTICKNKISLYDHPIICNTKNDIGLLKFTKIVHFSDDPLDYLNAVI